MTRPPPARRRAHREHVPHRGLRAVSCRAAPARRETVRWRCAGATTRSRAALRGGRWRASPTSVTAWSGSGSRATSRPLCRRPPRVRGRARAGPRSAVAHLYLALIALRRRRGRQRPMLTSPASARWGRRRGSPPSSTARCACCRCPGHDGAARVHGRRARGQRSQWAGEVTDAVNAAIARADLVRRHARLLRRALLSLSLRTPTAGDPAAAAKESRRPGRRRGGAAGAPSWRAVVAVRTVQGSGERAANRFDLATTQPPLGDGGPEASRARSDLRRQASHAGAPAAPPRRRPGRRDSLAALRSFGCRPTSIHLGTAVL